MIDCPACGYDLRESRARCPECGLPAPATSGIVPWVYRRTLGTTRAFLQTVVIVTFRPKLFGPAVEAPVDAVAARQFRWRLLVVIALPLVGLWVAAVNAPGYLGDSELRTTLETASNGFAPLWIAGAGVPGVMPVGIGLAVWLILVTPGPWFRRGSTELRQIRAVHLSRYTLAPLAWLGLILTSVLMIAVAGEAAYGLRAGFPATLMLAIAALAAAGAGVLLWSLICMILALRASTGAAWRWVTAAALGMLVMFAGSLGAGVVLFPMAAGLVRFLLDTVRR